MILEKHLDTIIDLGIDLTVAGVKIGYRKLKKRKASRHASTLMGPMSKTTIVDGVSTKIIIHPAS